MRKGGNFFNGKEREYHAKMTKSQRNNKRINKANKIQGGFKKMQIKSKNKVKKCQKILTKRQIKVKGKN